jgi:anaerobic magnesium-protoporphyrin IX monomethyl ester cyclase
MTRRLDLLLVNPGSRAEVYQKLGNSLAAIEPPSWAGMIASYMRRRGFGVEILDAAAIELSPDAVGQAVQERDPLLTALVVYGQQPSASTQNMTAASKILRSIRQQAPDATTLILGGHVSALPQRTLTEEEVDFVCEGEGPRTIEQLLGVLASKERSRLEGVEGLWWREEDEIRHNSRAKNLTDLDRDLPEMAWDLLPMERYRAHNWHCFDDVDRRQPYASLYTSLGCPFSCSFCCINAPFGKPGIRYRSPERVVAELELLVREYGVRNLKIVDEMFVLNPRHVEGICDGILERGLELNIWAYARIDTVTERLLPKLKRAGVNWLALGIESGSALVRDGAHKGFKGSDIAPTVRTIQEHGIYVIGNYIFGLPDDGLDSMGDTLEMALALNCEFANFYVAMAYPGSRLYQLALGHGWKLPERWSAYSQHAYDTLPLPTHHLSACDVLRFRDQAFTRYFTDTRYLDLVETRFGPRTRQHVVEMATHRLERKHA